MMSIFRHYWGTTAHKFWVLAYTVQFCFRLILRALKHDLSKYGPTESKGFLKVIHKLKGLTYGSDEYQASMKLIQPSIQAHYARNRHHPEHYPEGIQGFSLEDLCEMWADWRAAVRRHENGDIRRSVEINKDRYDMGETLYKILKNSV